MANITYIVGNGLDLSLGLKTSYRDFYDHVKSHGPHPDNRIYKAIAESPESWADFELSLGKYTAYIDNLSEKDKKQESMKFHDELEEVREDLAAYLGKEEQLVDGVVNNLKLTHDGFLYELPVGQKGRIGSIVSQGQTIFQFVTLNYTRTLEAVLANSTSLLAARSIRVTDPHHIHGDLFENLTLGVSDESQLSSNMSGAERDDLIKPNLIYSMNDDRIEILNKTIKRSSVIVFFGTSIGETDKYIWQTVMDWLAAAVDRQIIIHSHDNAYTDSVKRSSRMQKQFISSSQEKLLRFSRQDGDSIAELKNRIFVIHNTKKLFVPK